MSDDYQSQLTEDACKYLNYCRKVANMDKEDFLLHYNYEMSDMAKRDLNTLPSINEMPSVVEFPCVDANPGKDSQIPSPASSAYSEQSHLRSSETQIEHSYQQTTRNTRIKRRNTSISSADSNSSYRPSSQRPAIEQSMTRIEIPLKVDFMI
jgi:hypothetical protein